MSHISPEKMGNATSIFNLMRNIGGSIGIAIMTTFLARRTQLHQNHLVANVTAGNLKARSLLEGMRANFYLHGADKVTASRKALAGMYGLVQQHASMLAFVEAFWVMGAIFLLMLPFLPLLKYSKKEKVKAAEPRTEAEPLPADLLELEEPGLPDHVDEAEHELVFH
jgi:MFS transporter, DHA2 family, multidrug resistance protein